ncbi:sensor domain-containing diguanylate cyclase [Aeromonas cavernicola]|uniref:diguanylate cyclase n=1 Tax=Aeromonas cavernicola TaxID=1006623 RepID=A0A2H9U8N8_9GAMM|nr:sensor domain-containing diguanylate cyclase [Aeromonas cavernicola]PJG60400.1 GGDEF domain-containing protein [Aeromonas cavernicola]
MQEWDPEKFTSFEQLCEASLATIAEKTAAECLYLWLQAPTSLLYRFQQDRGLITLDDTQLATLPLPHEFISHAVAKGQMIVEQVSQLEESHSTQSLAQPKLRACFPLKRQQELTGVIYLETHRRLDRLSRHQRQGIQLLTHYLTAELSNHLLARQIDLERGHHHHTQTDLVHSQRLQGSFLTMLQALHHVSVKLSCSQSEAQLLYDAVLLARQELLFDRVAIFLIEPDGKTMRGTWGTNEAGELVNEQHFISPIPNHPTVQEALRRKDYVLVLEDAPLYYEHQQVGWGWNAMVSLWNGPVPIGWIAADNLLCHRPLKAYQCEIFKQYAAILSQLLIRQRTQEELEQLNHQLEARVADRTMQLAATNRALEEANHRLSLLSLEDPLTGIANRRQWDITMQREWEWARRHQSLLAVLMIDVDEFKAYNDHFGHAKGDKCLQQVAEVLKQAERRRTNLVARYGGEEFVILLCGPLLGEAEQLAVRIHEALAALRIPHPTSSVADFITVSIGFSYLVPAQDGTWQSLTEQADKALYHAKSQGRACTLAYG